MGKLPVALATTITNILEAVTAILPEPVDFNVIKFAHNGSRVSLLFYPTFDTDATPALAYAVTVCLPNGFHSIADYRHAEHPPVLSKAGVWSRHDLN